jgi:GYF domain 2
LPREALLRAPIWKNDMTDTTTSEDAWFYTQGGERKGPVGADQLRELLAAQTIDHETPIWKKGQTGWQSLRTTEIGTQLNDLPPPIAARDINNGLVWTLAFMPLAYLLLNVIILKYSQTQIIDWQYEDPVHTKFYSLFIAPLTWLVPIAINGALCIADSKRLECAGYNSRWMKLFALLLAPVYLFARAQRLRQTPSYGFVWVGTFIASILLQAL